MKKIVLSFLGCCLCLSVFSQRDETLFGSLDITGLWGGPATNFTKFDDDYTAFGGGNIGLEFNRSLFIGYGWYKVETDKDLDFLDNQRLNMRYNGLMLGYAIKPYKVLHPRLMLLTGSGRMRLDNGQQDRMFILQPSVGLELNVFQWFRIGIDGGYRFATDVELPGVSDSDVSAPFGEIKFYFGWSSDW